MVKQESDYSQKNLIIFKERIYRSSLEKILWKLLLQPEPSREEPADSYSYRPRRQALKHPPPTNY